MLYDLIFYGFAGLSLIGAVLVITSSSPVRAALSLILVFVTTAALWLLLEAEFLAMTLVLVYVGAVMVLFLFVIMMLDVQAIPRDGRLRTVWMSLLVATGIGGTFIYVIEGHKTFAALTRLPLPSGYSHVEHLALLLFTEHLYAFEVAGMLLLAAIIAAIALTFRGRRRRKSQSVAAQVQATKAERLRVIKMPAEGV